MATTVSCHVNFLASVYMAEKKNVMAMVTALSGAATNVLLNLLLIPRSGANGAAFATLAAFIVVFITRGHDTRRFIKIRYKTPLLVTEMAILATQALVLFWFEAGWFMYLVEAILVVFMLVFNRKPIKELYILLVDKFLKKKK